MPSPADDRMDALSEAIVNLLRRMERIESRLSRLESVNGISEPEPLRSRPTPAETPAAPEPPRVSAPPPPPAQGELPVPSFASTPPSQKTNEARQLETRMGLTWINRVATLTLIFAAAFFFKYAVDNQWIGETGRVVLGVLAGFATVCGGEFLWRKGHRVYAQGITATGLAVLYLSFFAAFGFYQLIPQGLAFVLMAVTVAFGGALAIRYMAPAVSILALVGGYLTPLLLSTHEDRPWVFFGYLLLLNAGAMLVARAQRWRSIEALAVPAAVVLYLLWFFERFQSEKQLVATVFVLAFYALFAFVETPVLFGVFQAFASLMIFAISPSGSPVYLGLLLLLAASGIAVAERRGWDSALLVAFGAFWCFAGWYALPGPAERLERILIALTAGFLIFLTWAAWRILLRSTELRAQHLAVVALNGAAYFGLCYRLLDPDYHAYLGLLAVALAGVHLALGMRVWKTRPAEQRDVRTVLLLIGVALAFLTLAVPIQFAGYRITMAWAAEGAALAWIGVRAGSRRLVYCSLAVFGLTLARLHFVDAWIYSGASAYRTIANTRFLTFAIVATCLWLSARWIWTGLARMAPYVAGHSVLLWALIMEVIGWAERNAAPANVANVTSVGVSVLLAVYGVLLIGSGVLMHFDVNRLLGLGLLAFVVLKLYFCNVWQLVRIYRVIAFGFLGILLLVASFLYSRYRTTVERWWRDDESPS